MTEPSTASGPAASVFAATAARRTGPQRRPLARPWPGAGLSALSSAAGAPRRRVPPFQLGPQFLHPFRSCALPVLRSPQRAAVALAPFGEEKFLTVSQSLPTSPSPSGLVPAPGYRPGHSPPRPRPRPPSRLSLGSCQPPVELAPGQASGLSCRIWAAARSWDPYPPHESLFGHS